MATMNFSVPEEIRRAFNRTFLGRNKSAIVTGLMRDAVDEEKRRLLRGRALDALLALRESSPVVRLGASRVARQKGRP